MTPGALEGPLIHATVQSIGRATGQVRRRATSEAHARPSAFVLLEPESPAGPPPVLLVCRQHRQIVQAAAVRSAASFSHGRDTPLPRSCSRANVVSDIDAERATVMWSGQIERTRPRPARPSPLAQCRALVYDAASCRRHRRTVPRTAQSKTVLMLKKSRTVLLVSDSKRAPGKIWLRASKCTWLTFWCNYDARGAHAAHRAVFG